MSNPVFIFKFTNPINEMIHKKGIAMHFY